MRKSYLNRSPTRTVGRASHLHTSIETPAAELARSKVITHSAIDIGMRQTQFSIKCNSYF